MLYAIGMDGILLIDKPKGWTSHDAVAKVRASLGKEQGTRNMEHGKKLKVGHAGTLDPMATGLLILLVGKATKQQDKFTKLDKEYEAEITLGATSTTDDAEGAIAPGSMKYEVGSKKPSEKELRKVLKQFTGEIEQVPPQYSAIKVGGKRAYKTARAGGSTELKPRRVTIYGFKNVEYEYPVIKFTVRVSTGTYIRSLARDIGEALETGAYLSGLRRTSIGSYSVKNAASPEVDREELLERIIDNNQ